ncbi:hypothetical protein ACFL13_03240 [Patescibacteria group bacterium]
MEEDSVPPSIDIEARTISNEPAVESKPNPKSSSNKGLIAGTIFGIIIIAGVGFGFYSFQSAHKSEVSGLVETHEQEKAELQGQIDSLTAEIELLKNPPESTCENIYENGEYNFQICIPNEWKKDSLPDPDPEKPHSLVLALIRDTEDEHYNQIFVAPRSNITQQTLIDEIIQNADEDAVTVENRMLDDIETVRATSLVTTDTDPVETHTFISTIFTIDEVVFDIWLLNINGVAYEDTLDTYDLVVKSFRPLPVSVFAQ